jgi:hypothetical protein
MGNQGIGQGLIDPAEDLKLLPFWVVAEIIYGELSTEMEEQLRELAHCERPLQTRHPGWPDAVPVVQVSTNRG